VGFEIRLGPFEVKPDALCSDGRRQQALSVAPTHGSAAWPRMSLLDCARCGTSLPYLTSGLQGTAGPVGVGVHAMQALGLTAATGRSDQIGSSSWQMISVPLSNRVSFP
jgi:hypothetical protein